MCGIIGFIGGREAAPIVLEGLRKLEYRGYDSAGLAIVSDGRLLVRKDVGGPNEVAKRHNLGELPGRVAIGHTRWATHGRVTCLNAHPHIDCKGEIAVVHNGIIENYQELREKLNGHRFLSETDTEVIPHLLERYMENGASLEEALREVIKELRNSYAILAISKTDGQKIVGACRDKPLIIGLGEEGNFIASDTLAFTSKTNRIIFIEEGEMAVLTAEKVLLLDAEGRHVEKKVEQIEVETEDALKPDYPCYMLKEILEQPKVIRQASMQNRDLIMEAALDISRAKEVILTACGTSRYAAIIGRYLFSKLAKRFSDVVMASEFHYFVDSIDDNTLVIAISQSGETEDVLRGVKRARENDAAILSIVNRKGSLLTRMSDQVIYLNCGPELAVPATKSFTGQLVIFYLLSFAMMNRLEECMTKLGEISYLEEENLRLDGKKIEGLAERLKGNRDFYYIGRGINFAIAAEGALKLKEISYIHAEGMPAGELKHGTLALIEKGTPVVAICPSDNTFDETLCNVAEAKSRGAIIIGISDCDHRDFDEWIPIPRVDEIFYPLVSVVPLQLLAYHLAVARGLDPDRPRNLAKSVTVR